MISFEIKNRFTGAVQFTAQIDCDEGELHGVKIGLAVKWAIANRASLDEADLVGANLNWARLAGANLAGANLAGVNLDGARLDGADLVGANLNWASLAGANFAGAKIGPHTIARKVAQVRRDDGYEFIGFALDGGGLLIRAGCQTRLIADYRQHVASDYPDTPKAVETLAILDFIQARADAGKETR